MPEMDHDLIIVGAGPAGSATALHLARKAPALAKSTLILERYSHPREKLCCGALSIDSLRLLSRMGLDLREIPSIKTVDLRLQFEGRGGLVRMAGDCGLVMTRRSELDAWLAGKARAAGFAIQENTRVTRVRKVQGGVEVETDKGTLRARAVVGADGSNGVVRAAVAPMTNTGVGRSVEVLTGPASATFPGATCGFDDGYFEFRDVLRGNHGYTLNLPVLEKGERKRSFAVWDSRAGAGSEHGSLKEVVRADMAAQGFALSDYQLRGFPIRWYQPGVPLSAPGILLTGDAAGVCALVGEGISLAIGYGELAAESLGQAFASGDFSFADYTARVAKSPMGRALTRRTWLARAIYSVTSPRLQRMFWQRGAKAVDMILQRYVFNWTK